MTDIRDIKNLTPKMAESIIRGIAQFGNIIPGTHCFERMAQKTFDMQDVEYILKNGIIKEKPKFDKQYDNWKCKVEGRSIDGDKSIVITAIISHNELICITVMGDDRK